MENKNIVILKYSNKDYAPKLTIQEIIELCINNNIQFLVCHIEEYEYEKMRKELNLLDCVYEEHFSSSESTYNHFRYMCTYDIENHVIKFVNHDKIGKDLSYELELSEDCVKSSSNVPFNKEFESGKYGTGLKIYTTETVKNIMEFYNQNPITNRLLGSVEEKTPEKTISKKQEESSLLQQVHSSYRNR